jgi:hypothetical protein
MRPPILACIIFGAIACASSQTPQLKTAAAVLDRYKQALGGPDAIAKVQSETRRGEIEVAGKAGQTAFVAYARPFKSIFKITRPDGSEATFGFDGAISWSLTAQGASIDKDTPVEADRRDADLQYALHQPDYFKNLDLAGVTDFDGRPCYWLHGTTHWGKDNNQFYDVQTGLLAGYRFEADDSSKTITVLLFHDYKSFGGPLVATKLISRTGDREQTFTVNTVSYDPIPGSTFDLPYSVKSLLR